jgi:hypothetical protein
VTAERPRGRFPRGALLALGVLSLAGYDLALRLALEAAARRGDAPAVVRLAEQSPLDAYAQREAARVQGAGADDRRRAREFLEAALYARPKDPIALRLLAADVDASGDWARAAEVFVRAVSAATDDTDSALSIADERLEAARSRASVAALASARAERLEASGAKNAAAEERAREADSTKAARAALETVVRVRDALARDALGAGMVDERAATARALLADLPRAP